MPGLNLLVLSISQILLVPVTPVWCLANSGNKIAFLVIYIWVQEAYAFEVFASSNLTFELIILVRIEHVLLSYHYKSSVSEFKKHLSHSFKFIFPPISSLTLAKKLLKHLDVIFIKTEYIIG